MRPVIIAIACALASPTVAADSQVREARAADGRIICNAYHNWIVTTTSGPCAGFAAPGRFALGATFAADGKERTIRVIQAHQALQDLNAYGSDTKKGEWYCVGGETDFDLDQAHNDHALWLFIPRCEVISQADPLGSDEGRIVEPISPNEFLKLPVQYQATYVAGLMEGMSYAYYGDSQPDYSQFVACVRAKTLGDTTQDVVAFLRQQADFDEGVSTALAKTLGARCKH